MDIIVIIVTKKKEDGAEIASKYVGLQIMRAKWMCPL